MKGPTYGSQRSRISWLLTWCSTTFRSGQPATRSCESMMAHPERHARTRAAKLQTARCGCLNMVPPRACDAERELRDQSREAKSRARRASHAPGAAHTGDPAIWDPSRVRQTGGFATPPFDGCALYSDAKTVAIMRRETGSVCERMYCEKVTSASLTLIETGSKPSSMIRCQDQKTSTDCFILRASSK